MNTQEKSTDRARYKFFFEFLNLEPALGFKIINSKCQDDDGNLGHVQGIELGFFFFAFFFMRITQ
jgi:hypothetical protein